MAPPVRMLTNEGDVKLVDADQVNSKIRAGWSLESEVQGIQRSAAESEADAYSGPADTLKAGVAGVARTFSGGLSDAVLNATGHGREVRKLRENMPITSGVAEVAGGVGGALLGVGVPGLAAKASARIAGAAAGAGTLAQLGAAGLGAGVEGAAMGLGEGVSELALSEDPLTFERAASTLSSKMLYGGAIGAGAGTLAKGVELGITKGRGFLKGMAERNALSANVADDLKQLDFKGLSAAETAEKEALVQRQIAKRAEHPGGIAAYQDEVQKANPWAAISDGDPASLLNQSKTSLRKLMNDPKGLAQNPAIALKQLRIQEQAFERALNDADDIAKKLASTNKRIAKELTEELSTLPDHLDEIVLTGKAARRYGSFADIKVPKAGTVSLSREEASRFLSALDNGEVLGAGQEALKKLPDLIASNRGLQARIESTTIPKAELTSQRLVDIADARDALMAGGGPKSIGERMAGGAAYSVVAGAVASLPIPVAAFAAPFLGGAASNLIGEKVFGRLGKAMSAGVARNTAAIDAVFGAATKAVKLAPPLATRTLGAVAFAPSTEHKPPPVPGKPEKLPELYKKRATELREQMETGPDGAPRVRMRTRQRIADTLQPIAVAQPILADRMETLAVRRLEFLASKLPRRPDLGAMTLGPDTWQPSDMQMRKWARYVAAAEDPDGITERLASGSVTPEDAEVMREVYPEMLADITRQVLERLPTLRATLPYYRRLALSVLTGVPVDPSMDPRILRTLQSRFVDEPEQPKAAPQFGSVRNSSEPGTRSERREQGAI